MSKPTFDEKDCYLKLKEIRAALVYFSEALSSGGPSAVKNFENYSKNLSEEIDHMNNKVVPKAISVSSKKRKLKKISGLNKDGTKRKQSLRNLCHGVIHKFLQEKIGVFEFRSLSRSFQFKCINDTYTDVVKQMSENGIKLDTEEDLNVRLKLITSFVLERYSVPKKTIEAATDLLKKVGEIKSPPVHLKTSKHPYKKMAIEKKRNDDEEVIFDSKDSDSETDEDEEISLGSQDSDSETEDDE